MPAKKKLNAVVAICIQEPEEDGSRMDFGVIKGDSLRFLHQAFITDSIYNALELGDADVRLYCMDQPDRLRLVKIVLDYLKKKLTGKQADEFKQRFSNYVQGMDRWGIRIEKVFKECFDAGYERVLVVGSRTPTVTARMMQTAMKILKESDAIFGPTPEGRYYIIGMSGAYQIKLADFDWKSPKIYSEVAEAFTEKKLSWSELEIWYTVETPEELELLARDVNQFRFEGDEVTARETELVLERILSKLEP